MTELSDFDTLQQELENRFKAMADVEAQIRLTNSVPKESVANMLKEYHAARELFPMLKLIRTRVGENVKMVDVLETRYGRKMLLFFGVSPVKNEDCTNIILHILYNIGLTEISPSNIRLCHRIGPTNVKRPRPILVRFCSLNVRSAVWSLKSRLRGSRISIREYLTKSRQMVFGKARQYFGVKAVWTQDAKIVVKSPNSRILHKMTSVEELNDLIKKYPKTPKDTSTLKSEIGVASTSGTN